MIDEPSVFYLRDWVHVRVIAKECCVEISTKAGNGKFFFLTVFEKKTNYRNLLRNELFIFGCNRIMAA